MILTEAYDYMDLLLDKADQPYFVTEEKNKFLSLAISEFINMHYKKMHADEDSRRALSGCSKWNSFSLSASNIVDGTYVKMGTTYSIVYDNKYPAPSEKYDDATSSDVLGYWAYGYQYVLPKQHLYTLSVSIKNYNKDEIINPSTGLAYAGVTTSDVVFSEYYPVKNISVQDFYEQTEDPFNISIKEYPVFSYIENRMVFGNPSNHIAQIVMQTIVLPTVEQAFSSDVWGSSSAPYIFTFTEHYQKQIVQMAVRKMSANVESQNYPQQQFESQV